MNPAPDMSAPNLSVIIAVYNVEPWLRQCLDSVMGQDLDPARYEVILVDDGSTDGSASICKEYAARYGNVLFTALPGNSPGGVGIPANRGMRKARGTYIGFVDSDDCAHPSMFGKLLDAALPVGADLALCDFAVSLEREGVVVPAYDRKDWEHLFSPAFAALSLVEQKRHYLRLSPVPWRKVYRREFLARNDIRFPEGDFFCEDNPFHWRSVILAERIVQVNESLILHRFQREGQATAPDMADRCEDMLCHLIDIRDFLKERRVDAEYGEAFQNFMVFVLYMVRRRLPEYRELAQELLGPVDVDGLFDDSSRGRE